MGLAFLSTATAGKYTMGNIETPCSTIAYLNVNMNSFINLYNLRIV